MKKYVIPIIAVILILVLALAILPAPEPERCAICNSIPFHAPALVKLETGEVGELEVYEPHPFKVAELNEYQQGGTFSFIHAAGLNGYSDTANWETNITVPLNENEYEEKHFCRTCRNLISRYKKQGYILLDLKDPGKPVVFEIHIDMNHTFRCYEIKATTTETEGELEIIVCGTLYA